jgi:KDO2-lipid IV(A) lauroyltransferase
MLRLSMATREDVIARTDITEAAAAVRAIEQGRGVIVVTGHLGNWELGAAAFSARGYPVDVIAKRAANPLFYDHILEARARLGIRVIDMAGAPKQVLRAIGDGRAIGFAADQHAGGVGVRVPFFGRPTAMFRGPAVIALRTGAPLFIALPIRRPDGSYDVALEPIDTTPTDDSEADTVRITAAWAARLEDGVRLHPEQYLWHHRRWRDR